MGRGSIANNIAFYKNKRVLVTGHSGFKGAWLSAILHFINTDAVGYALEPVPGSLYEEMQSELAIKDVYGNLLDSDLLEKTIKDFQPEIIIHLGAYGFLKECYDDPVRAYHTNMVGSLNLLESVRKCESVKSVVLVSTDKVYENQGDGSAYDETDALGASNPYSCSKICMEILARDYRDNFLQNGNRNIGLATVRASNVLAGGDHVQTRLIPSILRAVDHRESVELRNPNQTRPWQSVLDALNGYLTIARFLYEEPLKYSGAWNIGPTKDGIRSVLWILQKIQQSFRTLTGEVGDSFEVQESMTLGLDIEKALCQLDWKPQMNCDEVVESVVDFYLRYKKGERTASICLGQIKKYYQEEA